MKPEKFVGIILITLLLSCKTEEQTKQKTGMVTIETNQHIMNSSFDIDVYIDGSKAGILSNQSDLNKTQALSQVKFEKKLDIGVHDYEIKIYSYNGEPGKSVKGKFIINQDKTSEVFIDFKNYKSWI